MSTTASVRRSLSAGKDAHRSVLCFIRYEVILHTRGEFLKRFDAHRRQTDEIREKLQRLHDDLQDKPKMKIKEIDVLRHQLDRYIADLRPIQAESVLLDRLIEESQSTLIDSQTHRTLFFVVETRMLLSLLDTVDQKVMFREKKTRSFDLFDLVGSTSSTSRRDRSHCR